MRARGTLASVLAQIQLISKNLRQEGSMLVMFASMA
jgi:hypothetical protein